LDEYVVREFLGTFLLVLSGFVMLMLVFTFFELIGDILRNHIGLSMIGEYLRTVARRGAGSAALGGQIWRARGAGYRGHPLPRLWNVDAGGRAGAGDGG